MRITRLLFAATFALTVGVGVGWMMTPNAAAAHGGGLNRCGCHFNRTTNECHCHRDRDCGCTCQPDRCE